MRDLHESGENLGAALAFIGVALLVVGVFVPVLEDSHRNLLATKELDGFTSVPILYLAGGVLTVALTAAGYLSGRGVYAVLGALIALAVYGIAIALALSGDVLANGRGTGIYLITTGAAIAAIGALAALLFAPDYFDPKPAPAQPTRA